MSKDISNFFTESELEEIQSAIAQAELNTSGEIRVHIENKCKGNVLDRAAYIFKSLEMHQTEQRNGVLFYLAIGNNKFAILGDAGINSVVPENFWEEIKKSLTIHFKDGAFVEGLKVGIEKSGEKLKEFFPYEKDDINELPNEISFNNN